MTRKAKRLHQLALYPVMTLFALMASASVWANPEKYQVNMKPGVTDLGHEIYDLHMFVFWICVALGVVVFGLLFYSVFAFRKSAGAKASDFHENTTLELAWTVVPFLLCIVMAWPATKTLIDIYDTSEADMDVLVTGYQWKWKYEYLDPNGGESVKFFSSLRTSQAEIHNEEPKGSNYLLEVDNPVVIPVNKKVRFLITANDVLHAWWVPALAVKRDAIPGFVNEVWTKPKETGVYRGQCAELCGRDHGFMPIVVSVVEQAEYDQWLADKKKEAAELAALVEKTFTMDELVSRGKNVYQSKCVACHGANGEGGVGKALAGSPVVTGSAQDHTALLINGVPGSAMQAFGAQLSEVDLAAVLTYQRNAWGNNMGDMVQPVDVYNVKKGQ